MVLLSETSRLVLCLMYTAVVRTYVRSMQRHHRRTFEMIPQVAHRLIYMNENNDVPKIPAV